MQDQIRQEDANTVMRNAQPQHAKCGAKRLGRLILVYLCLVCVG